MKKAFLIGYGKMGRRIHELAETQGCDVIGHCNKVDEATADDPAFGAADVVIEFTSPFSVVGNLEFCLHHNKPVVTGSTGWEEEYPSIKESFLSSGGSLFSATNFSIGANIVFAMNRRLAKMMAPFEEYKLRIEETHHLEKKDAPSGTAISLAQGIIEEVESRKSWINDLSDSDDVVSIISHREPDVKGYHEINYKSDIDEIQLSHQAFSRDGFVIGALTAAKWLIGKKGVFGMDDMLNL